MNTARVIPSRSEVMDRADFSEIRYAQCWEDADILISALALRPGAVCLSIASAGDNALSLLAFNPERVIALDLNPAQLACLALRVAAYRELDHGELLELVGSRCSTRRVELYRRCRPALAPEPRRFWDAHPIEIARGIGGAGKFERYFSVFRNRVLPIVHTREKVAELLAGGTRGQREHFYEAQWNTWRWRLMFRLFFSRFVMGRLGRDPGFFKYVEGSVAERILGRTRHALTALDPSQNPYLQWILTGAHTTALPFAFRPENFEKIRANLDRLEWRCQSIEEFLDEVPEAKFDAFNLSDIFEYMSLENTEALLRTLASRGTCGARLFYWNMLAPRSRPETLAAQLKPLPDVADELFCQDKAFFYSRLIVEEVL
ncbi:DUF3419 family protein [Verrucomicrobiota bacterium sgz303538]